MRDGYGRVSFYGAINVDGIVKSPKRANFQILHPIISISYEA